MTPTRMRAGGAVVVSGAGFSARELIRIYFITAPRTVTSARATVSGLLPATRIVVPSGLKPGRHRIVARGVTSKRRAITALTVIPAAARVIARVTATPATINRGGLVTISGAGFAAHETVRIYFAATPKTVTSARATADGLLPATGVTVPYALTSGAHRLIARGVTSKRVVYAEVIVRVLAPRISLSATTVRPGSFLTVTGRGFGDGERVTLSLNGAALPTRPSVVITTNGAFTAVLTVPQRLLSGDNTISAVGNRSRVAAVATLIGILPVAAQFYFAGAPNTATEHSFIDLLNPYDEPTRVRLTFYFDSGASYTERTTVAPHAKQVVSAGGFGLPPGTFGLALRANRRIAAQIDITRDGKDGDTLLGNTGLGTTWYLAEGYTGLTFHETVSILNPANAPAQVQLRLLPLGGGAGKTVALSVAPHSTYTADINAQLPNQSVSIIATSDRPVVVERTLTFSNDGYGLTTRAGINSPATSWLFAEGTTVNRFQTFLTILNPNTAPAQVTASFFGQTGGSLGSRTIVVAGQSRANLRLNDFLSASGIASVVTSNLPIVVERPEYFGSPNAPRIAGSDVFGRNGAGVRWSFPGGNTASNSEFLLLYNPSVTTIPVDITFYGDGGQTLRKRVYVPPTVRYNVDVNSFAAGFAPVHGTILRSANGQGFVAEQTVFAPDHSTLQSTQGLAQ